MKEYAAKKEYTTKEAAIILNVNYHTVNKLIKEGKLRATRIREPGPWFISEKSINDFSEKRSLGYLRDIE